MSVGKLSTSARPSENVALLSVWNSTPPDETLRILPDQVNKLDFGKWHAFLRRNDGLLAAKCGDESLLWNSALGLGVRTDIRLGPKSALFFQSGSFFVATATALYIVPMVTQEGEAAAAYARPLPTQLPAYLPFVRARLLSTGTASVIFQPTRSNAPLLPPVFISEDDNRLYSCI